MDKLTYFRYVQHEIASWRQHLHTIPELLYDLPKTTRFIEDKLREFGVDEMETGIAQSGIVALIHGRNGSGDMIGLRADMDALPIAEASHCAHCSTHSGQMHGCGHDGHSAMLLGTARYLCETRNFSGTVALIFQPAEEGGAGGKAMLEAGLAKRWPIKSVYGFHNQPGMAVGQFAIKPGPMLASSDTFHIEVIGKGGHAAAPQTAIDPLLCLANIMLNLQSIIARTASPFASAAISVTGIQGGDGSYISIPETATMWGTIRTLDEKTRELAILRVTDIAKLGAEQLGAFARVTIKPGYPVLVNDAEHTDKMIAAALAVGKNSMVDGNCNPILACEDFAFLLASLPGAYMFVGNGDTAALHNSNYDFNDEAIPYGCALFAELAESANN